MALSIVFYSEPKIVAHNLRFPITDSEITPRLLFRLCLIARNVLILRGHRKTIASSPFSKYWFESTAITFYLTICLKNLCLVAVFIKSKTRGVVDISSKESYSAQSLARLVFFGGGLRSHIFFARPFFDNRSSWPESIVQKTTGR